MQYFIIRNVCCAYTFGMVGEEIFLLETFCVGQLQRFLSGEILDTWFLQGSLGGILCKITVAHCSYRGLDKS